ncbi:unnamed protein product [Rhizopus stolonifer]
MTTDNSNNDWFSVCKSHLADFNFCSKFGGPPKPKATKKENIKTTPESDSVSDLVSTIGSAWKSWRSKDTTEEGKKEEKKEEEKKEEEKEEEKKDEPVIVEEPTIQPVRFVLQKDYFYLRQREHAKKRQKKEASEKIKTLQFPEVPKQAPR